MIADLLHRLANTLRRSLTAAAAAAAASVAVIAGGVHPAALAATPAEGELAALEKRLEDTDNRERREAVYQLEKLGAAAAPLVAELIEALDDEDDQVWHGATMTLAAIGPAASPAIEALTRQMAGGRGRYEEQRRHRSAYALSRIGEAALPALVEVLNDPNKNLRWGALHALGLMGTASSHLVPQLVPLLGDDDESVRREAEEALVALGDLSVEFAARQLTHENPHRREGAARVLRRLGLSTLARAQRARVLDALLSETDPSARAALLESAAGLGADPEFLAPLLVQAVLGDEEAQDAAFNAVIGQEPLAREIVPKLALLLAGPEARHRERAARILGRLGERAVAAAPMLVKRLHIGAENDDPRWYVEALVLMGPGVIPVVFDTAASVPATEVTEDHWTVRILRDLGPLAATELESRLEGANPTAACAILLALPEYRRRHRPLERQVLALIDHENEAVRTGAVTMLQRLPIPEQVWLKTIRDLLDDPSPRVRVAALGVLDQTPLSPEERLKILTQKLDADEETVRGAAVRALGRLGPAAKPAIPQILAAAQGPSAKRAFRADAIRALGRMGEAASSGVPFLVERLSGSGSEKGALQEEVLEALGTIGKPAAEALPSIRPLIEHEDDGIRQAALAAFARIEPEADKLVPVYLKALQDPSPEVRQPVIDGLGQLGERGRPAAATLVDLLDSEPDREAVLEALREIRPDDVSLCLRLLRSEHPAARLLACDQLGRLRAKEAIPELRKAERDDYGFIRRRAREALERIEGGE